ncbi:MAG: alpha/beta fold hydrolase [Bacteroidia bacterium]|nr:alpha/beta fold hydrolase [Bacteroidia bacterium]
MEIFGVHIHFGWLILLIVSLTIGLVLWLEGCRPKVPEADPDQQVDEICRDLFRVEWEGRSGKIPFSSNLPVQQVNEGVSTAIIMIPGAGRNATGSYQSLMEVSDKSQFDPENTFLASIQFLTQADIDFFGLDSTYLRWHFGSRGWKYGFESEPETSQTEGKGLSSFAALEQFLEQLRRSFPHLQHLVLAGHSAGGQFVNRFAAASAWGDQKSGFPDLTFIISNPSSYLYFDPSRPTGQGFALPSETRRNACPAWDRYRYGLSDLNGCGFVEQAGVENMRAAYGRRKVIYLLGEEDNDPMAEGLDKDCGGMLQGENRLERGKAYYEYLKQYYGESLRERQFLVIVPGVGHSAHDIFTSPEGLAAIRQALAVPL